MEMMYAPASNKGRLDPVGRQGAGATQESERQQCLRYVLFSYNLVVFLCGSVLLGVGIWMAVDRNFMTTIIGNDLYAVAVFLILSMGGIVFFISFLGCCGAVTENRCMMIVFLIALCVITLGLFLGGILAVVFSSQLGEKVRDTMSSTLVDHYGVDFHLRYNRQVTDAWDKAQERLECCAVETEDWDLYQESKWFAQQVWNPGGLDLIVPIMIFHKQVNDLSIKPSITIQIELDFQLQCCGVSNEGWSLYRRSKWFELFGAEDERRMSHEDQKPYVPRSCCVKDRFWRYINLDVCQKWRFGPPGAPVEGAVNRALYYEGCYDAGIQYLKDNSVILVGLGIGIAILLVAGIILSCILLFGDRFKRSRN